MKLKVDYFDNLLYLDNENILVIEIENKSYFYKFVSDLFLISNGGISDNIIIFNNQNEEISLKLKVIIDYFNFDFKKNNTDLTKYLSENISVEDKTTLINLYNKLVKNYNKILNKFDIPFDIINDFDISNITKVFKVNINQKNDLLDNLILIFEIEKNIKNTKILVLINLKQYLTKEELLELYKYSLYIGLIIILVDSQSYGVTLKYEKKLIVDENLDEFMI